MTLDQCEIFINNACDKLKQQRKLLNEITSKIVDELAKIYNERQANITFRVKSEISLKEKIIRKGYFSLYQGNVDELFNNMSDLIGIRINCLLTKDEKEMYDTLKNTFSEQIADKPQFYISKQYDLGKFEIKLADEQPQIQQNGKPIYRIDGKWIEEDQQFGVEIQIKSSVHGMWGEIEHKLFYKNYDYVVEQSFFSEMMQLLYENLYSVEKQVGLVKQHLENRNNSLEEHQEMLSRILYNKFSEGTKELVYGCVVDFRPIYRLVAEMYLDDPNNVLGNLKRAIDLVEDSSVVDNKLQIKTITSGELSRYGKRIQKIMKIVNSKILEEEYHWKHILDLYRILFNKNTYVDAVSTLAVSLEKRFYKILTTTILVDIPRINLGEVIIDGGINYFEQNGDYRLFLATKLGELNQYIDYLNTINTDDNESDILITEEVKEKEVKKQKIFLDEYFRILFKIIYHKKIEEADIEFLKEQQTMIPMTIISDNDENDFKECCNRKKGEDIIEILLGKRR